MHARLLTPRSPSATACPPASVRALVRSGWAPGAVQKGECRALATVPVSCFWARDMSWRCPRDIVDLASPWPRPHLGLDTRAPKRRRCKAPRRRLAAVRAKPAFFCITRTSSCRLTREGRSRAGWRPAAGVTGSSAASGSPTTASTSRCALIPCNFGDILRGAWWTGTEERSSCSFQPPHLYLIVVTTPRLSRQPRPVPSHTASKCTMYAGDGHVTRNSRRPAQSALLTESSRSHRLAAPAVHARRTSPT